MDKSQPDANLTRDVNHESLPSPLPSAPRVSQEKLDEFSGSVLAAIFSHPVYQQVVAEVIAAELDGSGTGHEIVGTHLQIKKIAEGRQLPDSINVESSGSLG